MALVRIIGSDEQFEDGMPEALKPSWILIMRTGVVGQFESNPSLFDEIVRDFEPERPIPVVLGRERVDDPAIGWIFQLESRGADGLWGRVSWVEPQPVGYAHASPAVQLKCWAPSDPDRTELAGKRILDVLLTNLGNDIAGRL